MNPIRSTPRTLALVTGGVVRSLFKMAVQQGRSKRRGEAYSVPYVEPLRAARTPLAAFFNRLPMVCLLAVGLWQIGEGSWIYAKARLAQLLLQRAWSRTLAGEADVKPWPWADTWPVARLTVPSKRIDLIVLNGAYGRTLAFGPGFVESSAPPGSTGTTILTGHRDTHFSFLKNLIENDEIVMETARQGRRRYRVEDLHIVDSRSASVALKDQQARLMLVTCYPFDTLVPGGPLRYVVTAAMVDDEMDGMIRATAGASSSVSIPKAARDEAQTGVHFLPPETPVRDRPSFDSPVRLSESLFAGR
jgi:sortase A